MSTLAKQIAHETAGRLRQAAPAAGALRVVVGLDGFVDEIVTVVDKRHDSMRFDPLHSIEQFGQRIRDAAGQSSNVELVVKQVKLGGNGPILAGAMLALGTPLTYLGALGDEQIHPVFAPLAAAAQRMISIAEPGHTDALEFDDGKIMLCKPAALADVSWQRLTRRISPAELVKLFNESALVALVNWTEVPHASDIWTHLIAEVLPHLRGRRQMLIDLADPEKRTSADLLGAIELLSRFGQWLDVTLGLNLKEARQVARVLGIPVAADDDEITDRGLEQIAGAIRERIGLACVAVHVRSGAAAATEHESAAIAGPFVREPKISTGAGDHFNAGFALGRLLSLSLPQCLCAGVATSGYYVRTAKSPTLEELADFVADLPEPEQEIR
jgi:hypothetical protein